MKSWKNFLVFLALIIFINDVDARRRKSQLNQAASATSRLSALTTGELKEKTARLMMQLNNKIDPALAPILLEFRAAHDELLSRQRHENESQLEKIVKTLQKLIRHDMTKAEKKTLDREQEARLWKKNRNRQAKKLLNWQKKVNMAKNRARKAGSIRVAINQISKKLQSDKKKMIYMSQKLAKVQKQMTGVARHVGRCMQQRRGPCRGQRKPNAKCIAYLKIRCWGKFKRLQKSASYWSKKINEVRARLNRDGEKAQEKIEEEGEDEDDEDAAADAARQAKDLKKRTAEDHEVDDSMMR